MTERLKHEDSPDHSKNPIQETPEGKQIGIFGFRSKKQRNNNAFELGSPRRTELENQEFGAVIHTHIKIYTLIYVCVCIFFFWEEACRGRETKAQSRSYIYLADGALGKSKRTWGFATWPPAKNMIYPLLLPKSLLEKLKLPKRNFPYSFCMFPSLTGLREFFSYMSAGTNQLKLYMHP